MSEHIKVKAQDGKTISVQLQRHQALSKTNPFKHLWQRLLNWVNLIYSNQAATHKRKKQ